MYNAQAKKTKVLIVDDDVNICKLVSLYLAKDEILSDSCHDGETALQKLADGSYDVVLFDIMMPGMDGLATLTELRKFSDVPVIVLSARGEPMDKISGLDKGADDYLAKPFEPQELIARIKAVLRRLKPSGSEPKKRIELFNLVIDLSDYTVQLDGLRVDMPPKEIELLYMLASKPTHVFTRENLLDGIWGVGYVGDPRTVDVHIKRVREKLGDNKHWKLTTVWGVGYKIDVF